MNIHPSDAKPQSRSNQEANQRFKRHLLKIGFGLLSMVVLLVASATLFSNQAPQNTAAGWAAWAFLHAVEANQIRRLDPDVVAAQQSAAFSIQNSEVVNQERRKDPAVVEAERLAAYAILHAKELETERRKDPELVRKEQEAWDALVSGAK